MDNDDGGHAERSFCSFFFFSSSSSSSSGKTVNAWHDRSVLDDAADAAAEDKGETGGDAGRLPCISAWLTYSTLISKSTVLLMMSSGDAVDDGDDGDNGDGGAMRWWRWLVCFKAAGRGLWPLILAV